MDEKKEYILCAAIKRKDRNAGHQVYYEKNANIYDYEFGWRHPDILYRFKGVVDTNPEAQGFLTSQGRVVSREEGAKIARTCGQLLRPGWTMNYLTTEDIY